MKIKLNSKLIVNIICIFAIYILIDILCSNFYSDIFTRGNTFDLAKITREKYDLNCKLIFEMDNVEIRRGLNLTRQINATASLLPDSNFIFPTSKCSVYKELRGFNSYKITKFEMEFPLAFSILTYDKVEQFERYIMATQFVF